MTLLVDTSVWFLALRRNACRRAGVQLGTIDALLIQFCGRHELTLLSTDPDFAHAAMQVPFRLWRPAGAA